MFQKMSLIFITAFALCACQTAKENPNAAKGAGIGAAAGALVGGIIGHQTGNRNAAMREYR